jgi:hypothetical protein
MRLRQGAKRDAEILLAAFPARRMGILVPNPYLAAFKVARAFCTTRAGIPCERPAPGEAIVGSSRLKSR